MERLMIAKSVLAAAVSLGVVAAPAAAQNSTAQPPVIPAPPPRTETPPATSAPAPVPPGTTPVPATPAEPAEPAPPETVVIVPQPQPAPAPVTIDPDAAYPEGFADPDDPFANDMADAYREERGGFDWGLLGLLGLLGLIPLLGGRGRERIVYVEREDEPRRVVRRAPEDE